MPHNNGMHLTTLSVLPINRARRSAGCRYRRAAGEGWR
jgi:hypothetical protein